MRCPRPITAVGLGEEQSNPKRLRNSRSKRQPSQSASVFSRPFDYTHPLSRASRLFVQNQNETDVDRPGRLTEHLHRNRVYQLRYKIGRQTFAGETTEDARFLTSKWDSGESRGNEIGLLRPFSLLDADFAISSRGTKLQRGSRILSWSGSLGRILQHLG